MSDPNQDTRFPILEAVFAVDSESSCSADFMGPNGDDGCSLYNQPPRSNDNMSLTSANGDFSPPTNNKNQRSSPSSSYSSKPSGAALALVPVTSSVAPPLTVAQPMQQQQMRPQFEIGAEPNQMFTDQQDSNYLRPADPNTSSAVLDEFEQRKRHRSAGPDVRNSVDNKPSYADLLTFSTRERRPSGGPAVGVATHYPSQSITTHSVLPSEQLPPVPPFTNMVPSANPFDTNMNQGRPAPVVQQHQGQFQQQQDSFQFNNNAADFSGGGPRNDKSDQQPEDSSESSSDCESYEPDSSTSLAASADVGSLMNNLSYQRAFCSLPPGRGSADFAGLAAMQLSIPAHHSVAAAAHLPQRHFSGPAGIPMNDSSSQQGLMMVDQQQQQQMPPAPPMGPYYPNSQGTPTAAAFLGSQIYGQAQSQQSQQQLVQHSNSATGGVNFLHGHHTNDPRRLVVAAAHNRHPSEPAPRPRRPSAGKSSRIALTAVGGGGGGGDHQAGSSQMAVVVRDEQRKRQHNDIEKRRRSNINERIQQLATLLPNCQDPEFKQHKGNILTKVVDYIKQLQGLPEQIASLQIENSKLMNQNLQLQQRVAALTEMVRSNGFQVANQVRFSDQNLIELATTGLANAAICHQLSPNDRSCSSQSLTPPGSRHPSGNAQIPNGVNSSSSVPPSSSSSTGNRSQQPTFSGDLMQMLCQQQPQQPR